MGKRYAEFRAKRRHVFMWAKEERGCEKRGRRMETVSFSQDDAGVYVAPLTLANKFEFPNPFYATNTGVVYRDLALTVTNVHGSDHLPLPFGVSTSLSTNDMECLLMCMVDAESISECVLSPGMSVTIDIDARAWCQDINGVYVSDVSGCGHVAFTRLHYFPRDALRLSLVARSLDIVASELPKASLGTASKMFEQEYSVQCHTFRYPLALRGHVYMMLEPLSGVDFDVHLVTDVSLYFACEERKCLLR
jgi:hypothetical protein